MSAAAHLYRRESAVLSSARAPHINVKSKSLQLFAKTENVPASLIWARRESHPLVPAAVTEPGDRMYGGEALSLYQLRRGKSAAETPIIMLLLNWRLTMRARQACARGVDATESVSNRPSSLLP